MFYFLWHQHLCSCLTSCCRCRPREPQSSACLQVSLSLSRLFNPVGAVRRSARGTGYGCPSSPNLKYLQFQSQHEYFEWCENKALVKQILTPRFSRTDKVDVCWTSAVCTPVCSHLSVCSCLCLWCCGHISAPYHHCENWGEGEMSNNGLDSNYDRSSVPWLKVHVWKVVMNLNNTSWAADQQPQWLHVHIL